MRLSFCTILACTLLVAAPAQAQEVVLRAVTPWARNFDISKSFQRYVDKVNAEGKGVVQIRYLGGPESMPSSEQTSALRNGVIDLYYGSAAFMLGEFPEANALSGSNLPPAELRANGAYEMYDQLLQKKMNAKFLVQPDSGWAFRIFLTGEPKRTAAGGVDLSGIRVRSHPLFRDFLSSLGAENVMVSAGEANTAFERNMLQGLAFAEIGIRDFGFERFVKYRISPTFYQSDILMLVNNNRWRAMPEPARNLLMRLALEHEKTSRDFFLAQVRTEMAELDKLGIKDVTLTGAAAEDYRNKAQSIPWSRLEKADAAAVGPLKAKFYKDK